MVLALALSAACGVRSSAIRDGEAARDRLAPHEITADFSVPTGDVNVETSGEGTARRHRRSRRTSRPQHSPARSWARRHRHPRPHHPGNPVRAAPRPLRSRPGKRSKANPAGPGWTEETIRIGIHAPVTGAAPCPQRAFEESHDLYWKFLAGNGGVHGRKVEVVFRDDKYNPTSEVQVCREMVEKEKVFAIIGFAGSDQITACARYSDGVDVPTSPVG